MLLSAKAFAYSDPGRIREENPRMYDLYDSFNYIVTGFIVVFFVFTFLISQVTVYQNSMNPGLKNTDHILIVPPYQDPVKGDIVVVAQEKAENPNALEPLIKRVIAVEGDTVDIDFEKGVVFVNGKALDESGYVAEPIHTKGSANDPLVAFPMTVQKNHIFVLGDNRNNSRDSRNQSVGQIDKRYVYGKIWLRYWPVERFQIFKNPWKD